MRSLRGGSSAGAMQSYEVTSKGLEFYQVCSFEEKAQGQSQA